MKSRKELICTGFAIVSLISFFLLSQIHSNDDKEILLDCFKATRANIEESVISGWVSLDTIFTEEDLCKKIDFVIEGLGIDKSKVKKTIEIDCNFQKGMLTSSKDSGNYTLILESMQNDDGTMESYCMFQSSFIKNYKDMVKEKEIAEKVFKKINMPIKLDSMITGSYNGKMTKKQTDSIISKVLKNLGASTVESIKNDDFISVSAYSTKIDEFIISNGKKVNVQIALRYSSYDDKTYIWISSPFMPFEY